MLLLFYTHIPEHGSTLFREASSCTRWQLAQTQLDKVKRMRDFAVFSLKWDVFINPPPLQGSGMSVKRRWGLTPMKQCLPDTTGLIRAVFHKPGLIALPACFLDSMILS